MARSTASRDSGLTFGEPLITRETVPRPTPARAATASSVGRAPVVTGRSPRASRRMMFAVSLRSRVHCAGPGPDSAVPDDGGVPQRAGLGDALLRQEVDVDEAEALGV